MKRILIFIPAFFFALLLKAQTITSAASGSWNTGSTWAGGVVPTAANQVIIAPSHSITLAANGACRTLTIQNGATNGSLTINVAGTTLTVGDFNTGGGKDSVVIRGDFTISNGALNIGGRLRQYTPGNYLQNGGIVSIDGNTGSAATSVADDQFLFQSPYSYFGGFTFSNGTLLFVDPTFGPSGNTMVWSDPAMYLNPNSLIQLGDGISTTAGGSTQGFIYSVYVSGKVAVNNPAGTNRMVTAPLFLGVETIDVIAGTLNLTYGGQIAATKLITNNGTITRSGSDLIAQQGVTNNGTISFSGLGRGLYCSGTFLNNPGGTFTADVLFAGGNITNNGTLTVNQVFGLSNSINSASTVAQTIGGTGTFNLSTAQLFVANTSAAGITLNTGLSVDRIQIGGTAPAGNVFLGNNNVTFKTFSFLSLGPNNSHFVANGTGRLRFTNLTTTEILFPVGTGSTFNPVSINNGSGHTFACGVKTGFTVAPPGTQHVNREWDIADITGGAVSASVTLQWQAVDEDPTFNRAACAVAHYGTSWAKVGAVGTASGTNPYTMNAANVTTFSPFTVSSNAVVLPLTLLNFTGSKCNGDVCLSWSTENELNFSHFEIEKSANASMFTSLSNVAARNLTTLNTYTLNDNNPVNGLNYYRLKIVDKDGRFTYSNVIKIDVDKKYGISILPNPAKNYVVINSAIAFKQIQIIDVTGKVVRLLQKENNNRYNVSGLSSGIYMVRLIAPSQTIITKISIE